MPEQIMKFVDPLKARWDLLTQPQRYKLIGVIIGVLLAITLMAYFAFRTSWTVIVDGRDWQVTSEMQNALNAAGIRNEFINNGTGLRVDSRRVEEARTAINLSGVAPNDAHFTWENALDTNLGTTDSERRRRDILGIQGAIASQLTDFDGILHARVNLSIPTVRPFELNPDLPSASVTLTMGQDFTAMQGRDLAMLVARNISNLTPERIIIMDQNARTIFNGAADIQNDAIGAAQEARNQQRVLAEMGASNVLSSVFDEVQVAFTPVFSEVIATETIQEIIDMPAGGDDGVVTRDIGSRSAIQGGIDANEPGLANNTAATVGYVNPGGGPVSADHREWDRFIDFNRTTRIEQTGPGGLDTENSLASVTVIRHVPIYQEQWMSQAPEGEERTQLDWEIFKAQNAAPQPITNDSDEYAQYAHFHSLAANAMGIPVENVQFAVSHRIIPHDLIIRSWEIPTIVAVAVLFALLGMLLYGLLRKARTSGEDEEALEPQLAVEDLLVSTQLEDAKEDAIQELEEIDYFKENEIKKHIEKFVNEKPEAVAALLRNWINVEEW
jgi:flagellar M-ring protein FliF